MVSVVGTMTLITATTVGSAVSNCTVNRGSQLHGPPRFETYNRMWAAQEGEMTANTHAGPEIKRHKPAVHFT